MIDNQLQLPLHDEIIVDNFAGGGGASTGIEMALGRCVDIAINHDPEAVLLHTLNHPQTKHYCENVWEVDPLEATQGRPVGLIWFSPDCKHHSRAKGGKPRDKNIRGLAWVALRWIAKCKTKPRVAIWENVSEFQEWCRLLPNGQPDPKQKGRTFNSFVNALKRHGYDVEYRELSACDYGAPTTRKRLFIIARCDGKPIVWPAPTHGDPNSILVKSKVLKPWKTAADCIDWSIECPSIFERSRDLVDATLWRIARSFDRYVVNSDKPFVVPAVCDDGRGLSAGKHSISVASLIKHYGGNYTGAGIDLGEPMHTITTTDHHAIVVGSMVKMRGTNIGSSLNEPVHTISAQGTHHAEVRFFLKKYCGGYEAFTSNQKNAIVKINGIWYEITDIGMRMLEPGELYKAQGFPNNYIFAPIIDERTGKQLSKKAQIRMAGNAVCPPIAAALVAANVPELVVRNMSSIKQRDLIAA